MQDGTLPPDIAGNTKLQNAFKSIQQSAHNSGVTLDNAIDFVESLSEEGKTALKNYHGLYNPISTENMSKEGAYNLLMEPSRRADLNKDGVVNIGAENSIAFPPVNFPAGFNEVYTEALFSMQKEGASVRELYRFSFSVFESQLAGGLTQALAGSEAGGFDFLSSRIDAIKSSLSAENAPSHKTALADAFASKVAAIRESANAASVQKNADAEAVYLEQFNAYEAAAKAAKATTLF
jgi:hypothetical protein